MDLRKAPSPTDSRRIATIALTIATGFYVVVRLALLAWASWRVRFVMDEMCFLTQFRYFDAGLYEGFDPVKTVLGLFAFNLPRAVVRDSASLLLSARMVGLAIALATVALVAIAAHRVAGGRGGCATALMAVLSFSNFTERSFRIRADTMAMLFATAGLAVAVGSGRRALRAWCVGGLAGAAFLSTQKAVYVALSFGLAYLASVAAESGWRAALAQAGRYAAGWWAAVLAYAIYFGGLDPGRVLRQVFFSPLDVAINAPNAYSNLQYYVVLSSRQNAFLYLLGVVGLTLGLARWRSSSGAERWALVATAVLVPLVLSHNQPWPYVLALPQAFLAVVIAQGVRIAAGRHRVVALLVRGLFLAAILVSIPRAWIYPRTHTNHEQIEAVRWAEDVLGVQDRYFDGIGMVPTRNLAGDAADWWWDRPTLNRLRREFRRGNLHVVERVLDDGPKLWILNYRLAEVWDTIGALSHDSYVRVTPLFYMAGTVLPVGDAEVSFRCRWGGAYRLFGTDGRPLEEAFSVDGKPETKSATIEPGIHVIRRAAADSSAVLLPVDTRWQGPLPRPTDPVPNLFAGVYEF